MVNKEASDIKIFCIIPARGGSKGVPKKNTRLFRGKPLIAWTIEEAKKSKWLDKIVVSTEDCEIADISIRYGVEVMKRPDYLALDTSSCMDVILNSLDNLHVSGYVPDHIILLQCTSPLRTISHIDEAIELYLKNLDHFDSLISVTKSEHNPWWMKKIDAKGNLVDLFEYDKTQYIRRQDFPDVYSLNGAIYIAKTNKFREYREFETARVLPYIMDSRSSLDIDTEMDFRIGEYIAEHMQL